MRVIRDTTKTVEYCPIFNSRFPTNINMKNRSTAPSLDRLVSSKGYVPGNIWIISHSANAIKSDATVEELEAVSSAVRKRLVSLKISWSVEQ